MSGTSAVEAPAAAAITKLGEIQALRTIAVLAVVLFHLAPTRLSGGFIGVDAFFVISGFLITSHLFKEVAGRGRIALGRFWARRVRRLLPAAFLVLLVTLAGTLLLLPTTLWRQVLTEIGASALYVQNWRLAFDAVDYFAAENLASPVQHYWSLSVEEQFYLVWPLLILAAVGLAMVFRRQGVPALRTAVTIAAGVVFAASLIYSIRIAVSEQSFGYFSTFSHAWEFAAGALLALVLPRLIRFDGRSQALRAAASWLGYAALVWSAFAFSGATLFPGYTALLPAAGVLLVIAAGRSTATLAPTRLVELRPVQYIGDISYSLYLWHWPPIVLLPYLTGHPLNTIEKAAILLLSVAAAGVTKAWVEDRFRFGALTRLSSPKTFMATALVSGILVAACAVPIVVVDQQSEKALEVVDEALRERTCFGAEAALDDTCAPNFRVQSDFNADFASTDSEKLWVETHLPPEQVGGDDCPVVRQGVLECLYGDLSSDTSIFVVGDSHARVFLPPLINIANREGWVIHLVAMSSCRPALPTYTSSQAKDNTAECRLWKQNMTGYIADADDVDLIVTTGAATKLGVDMNAGQLSSAGAAFAQTWATWAEAGHRVLAIGDVPYSETQNPVDCLAEHSAELDPCALPKAVADPRDPMDVAAESITSDLVRYIDLGPVFCDASTCHFVVGGVITHRDSGHLTTTFALTLEPFLERTIAASLK